MKTKSHGSREVPRSLQVIFLVNFYIFLTFFWHFVSICGAIFASKMLPKTLARSLHITKMYRVPYGGRNGTLGTRLELAYQWGSLEKMGSLHKPVLAWEREAREIMGHLFTCFSYHDRGQKPADLMKILSVSKATGCTSRSVKRGGEQSFIAPYQQVQDCPYNWKPVKHGPERQGWHTQGWGKLKAKTLKNAGKKSQENSKSKKNPTMMRPVVCKSDEDTFCK